MSPSPHPAFPSGRPLEVGGRFLLIPGEDPAPHGDRIPIRLARGRAFGSGLHETTASCMEELERLPSVRGRTVLDLGTGTGILSMAALGLGAGNAIAVDIDAEAVRTCRRNAALNGMGERLRSFQGTLAAVSAAAVFDLVLANLHGDIILREAQGLAERTREGGYLLLSGLDYTDNRPVRAALSVLGLVEIHTAFLTDFVTQVWRRPPDQG